MYLVIQFLTIISIFNYYLCDVSYRSVCGEPPVPPSATIYDNGQRLEGVEVDYQCGGDFKYLNYAHKLTCHNGTWAGPRIRCGLTMVNDVVQVDIYDGKDNATIQVFPGANDFGFNIAYREKYGTRVSTENLTSSDTYMWTVHLNLSMDIGFVRLDLNTPIGHKQLFNISDVFVAPNKVCRQTNASLAKYGRNDFFFECDITDGAAVGVESKEISFRTKSSAPLTIGLAGVFVAMPVDKCGRPEIPPFLRIPVTVQDEFTANGSHFEIQCAEGFLSAVSNSSHLHCNQNGLWEGSYPKCKPMSVCNPLEMKAHKVEYLNTIHHNGETYLVDQSIVTVSCQEDDPSLVITCRNGRWDTVISCETGNARKSLLNVVTISLSAIVLICIGVVIAMVVYTKQISADKGPPGVRERNHEGPKELNDYDSIRYSDMRNSEKYTDLRIYDIAENPDYAVMENVDLYDDVNVRQ